MPLPLHCIACGYDLRAVDAEGVCPECALGVRRSERLPIRRWVDERWIRRVRRGLGVGAVALGLHVVALGLLSCFLPITLLTGGNGPGQPAIAIWLTQLTLWVVGYLIAIPACVMAGRARRGGLHRNPVERYRVVLFWTPLAFVAIGIVMAIIGGVAASILDEHTPPVAVLLAGLLVACPLLVVNSFVAAGLAATAADRRSRRRATSSVVGLARNILLWCTIGPVVVLFMLILVPPDMVIWNPGGNVPLWVLWSAIWMVGGGWYALLVAGVLRRVVGLRNRLGRLVGE